jgi:hypothetical protein
MGRGISDGMTVSTSPLSRAIRPIFDWSRSRIAARYSSPSFFHQVMVTASIAPTRGACDTGGVEGLRAYRSSQRHKRHCNRVSIFPIDENRVADNAFPDEARLWRRARFDLGLCLVELAIHL